MSLPTFFDSQQQASAALGLSVEDLQQAKREGCDAFRSGRVYLKPLVEWVMKRAKNGPEDEVKSATYWKSREAQLRCEKMEVEVSKARGSVLDVPAFEAGMGVTLSGCRAIMKAFAHRVAPKGEGLNKEDLLYVLETEGEHFMNQLANLEWMPPEIREQIALPSREEQAAPPPPPWVVEESEPGETYPPGDFRHQA